MLYELSVVDPLAYNLELNKTGLKIHIKDKKLFFYDPDTNEIIASLHYVSYDRSRFAYVYSFHGTKKYYNSETYIGEVRSQDWDADKLLHPRRATPPTSGDIAHLFHNLELSEKSGTFFTLLSDE